MKKSEEEKKRGKAIYQAMTAANNRMTDGKKVSRNKKKK